MAGLQLGMPADAHDADHDAGRDAHDAGPVAVCREKCCRLMLMMRGLRPAALKSAASDAHDAGPELGLKPVCSEKRSH